MCIVDSVDWIVTSLSLPSDANTKRESGKKAQYGNIQAAKVSYMMLSVYYIIYYTLLLIIGYS